MTDENKPQGNIDWLKEFELDLEDKVSCDSDNCDNNAIFFSKAKCCGVVIFACRDCMIAAGRVMKFMVMKNKTITCTGCGKTNSAKGWLSAPQKLALDMTS